MFQFQLQDQFIEVQICLSCAENFNSFYFLILSSTSFRISLSSPFVKSTLIHSLAICLLEFWGRCKGFSLECFKLRAKFYESRIERVGWEA